MGRQTSFTVRRAAHRLAAACALLVVFANCAPDPEPTVPDDLGVAPPNNAEPDMATPDDAETPRPDMDTPRPDMDTPRPDMDAADAGGVDAGDDAGSADMAGDDAGDVGGDAGPDLCATVTCVNGSCVEVAGEGLCACDAGYAGETCDDCARGYTGANCDMCAAGFMLDPLGSGTCILDPCSPDPCNGNGACIAGVDSAGQTTKSCECDTGFTGAACDMCDTGYQGTSCDTCAAGYTMENGECVILACSPIPCTEHGLCADADGDGMAECLCDTGWTGRDCGTCAMGYVLDTATGDCVPDVCATVVCDHGACMPSPTGAGGVCVCDWGWDGSSCDVCKYGYTEVATGGMTECLNELPVRDARVTGWFDAMAGATIDLIAGDGVQKWWNRVQPYGMNEPGPADHRPRYLLLPKPGVVFDGNDTLWAAHSLVGITNAYSIFVVATWNPALAGNTLVEGFYGNNTILPFRIMAWSDTAQYKHGDGTGIPDSVDLTGYDPASGPQLIVAQRAPFLNGTAMRISDGTNDTTIQSTKAGFTEETLTQFGSVLAPTWGVRGLDGALHEVIIVRGTLTAAERDAIVAYLTVKWGL